MARTNPSPERRRRAAVHGHAVLTTLVLALAVTAFLLLDGDLARSLLVAAAGLAAIVSLVWGCLVLRPRPLAPWVLLAVAGSLFLAGYAVRPWSVGRTGAGLYLVDVLTLSGYLALLVGLGWLARAHGGMRREVLCDVLVASVAGALAALQHLVVPAVLLGGRPVGMSVLSAVYPLADVVLVCLLLDLLFAGPARRSHQLLTGAVAALLVGDLGYSWMNTRGVLLPPASFNLPFLVAYLLIAAAACHPSQRDGVAPWTSRRAETTAAEGVGGPVHLPDAWTWRRLVLLGASLTALVVLLASRPAEAPGVTRWAGVVAVAVVLALLIVRSVSAVNGMARARAVLAHRATHDALTDLPDREQVRFLVAARCERPAPAGQRHWMLYLDLDGFKRVNDSWGHLAGDQLLQVVADRLRAVAGPEPVVARLAGDEFVLAVTASDEGVGDLAQRLLQTIAEPVELTAAEVIVTASIGVTQVHGSPQTALREADAAMYAAKRAGRCQWLLYDDTMRTDQGAAIELELDLRHAIAEGGLSLHYQLIVDIEDERAVGTEALLRWDRPLAGSVPPTVFVPVLEETGLITPVGLWVVQEALGQLARWRCDGTVGGAFKMSVNVAPRQLMDPTFTGNVERLLCDHGLSGADLILEITESSMLAEADAVTDNLTGLRGLGISLAVDDFGTGYSALSYLRTLPVSRVKIDRSFVSGLGQERSDEALVRAVVAVSDALGLGVTAEGIETTVQRDVLRRLGVRHGQGWLWAKAAPADEVTGTLARQHLGEAGMAAQSSAPGNS